MEYDSETEKAAIFDDKRRAKSKKKIEVVEFHLVETVRIKQYEEDSRR